MFLDLNINVMTWNYRGYGWTRGSASPYNVKCDAEQILNFVLNKLHITGKIGVYGRSLGGIPSTHLASKYTDIVKLLIVDRTFARTELIATQKVEGNLGIKFFHDLFTFKWEAKNDLNYLSVPCYKICTVDPLDEIVPLFASLPVHAAKLAYLNHVVDKFVSPHNLSTVLNSLLLLFDFDHILHSALLALATDHLSTYLQSLGDDNNFEFT